jgi:hypothetical protein
MSASFIGHFLDGRFRSARRPALERSLFGQNETRSFVSFYCLQSAASRFFRSLKMLYAVRSAMSTARRATRRPRSRTTAKGFSRGGKRVLLRVLQRFRLVGKVFHTAPRLFLWIFLCRRASLLRAFSLAGPSTLNDTSIPV